MCVSLAVVLLQAAPARHERGYRHRATDQHGGRGDSDKDCPNPKGGPFSQYLGKLAAGRVEQLQRTVDELSTQLHNARRAHVGKRMVEMEARLAKLEGQFKVDGAS